MKESEHNYHPLRWKLDAALKENWTAIPTWPEDQFQLWFEEYVDVLYIVQLLEKLPDVELDGIVERVEEKINKLLPEEI